MEHVTGDSDKLILRHLVIVVPNTMILERDAETTKMGSVYMSLWKKSVILQNLHVEIITRLMSAVCMIKYRNVKGVLVCKMG